MTAKNPLISGNSSTDNSVDSAQRGREGKWGGACGASP